LENSLKKMAEQLDALDEASLLGLWEKYHNRVKSFEPTKEWEYASLILSMIQAVRWKNQLFNTKWADRNPPDFSQDIQESSESEPEDYTKSNNYAEKGKVISFFFKEESDKDE